MKIGNIVNKLDCLKHNRFYTKSNVNCQFQTNNLDNLPNIGFGVIFKGNIKAVNLGDLDQETMAKEIKGVKIARSLGIDTPKIQNNIYTLYGEIANAKTNPITPKHIKNVLKNILIMDKAGFAHGDIEKTHIFYCKDGNVEFDCFRFNWSFDDKGRVNWEFPEFCFPTNLKQYEGNSLGEYLSQINSQNRKNDFLKSYMQICSDFHSKKAQYIENSESSTQEQIEYEKLQAEIFKNPDENIIELFKNKIELMYEARLAFTEWDEGNGACGHAIDETRTTQAVQLYFANIIDILEYIEKIQKTKQSSFGNKLKYLKYEEKYAQDMLKKTIDSTVGMANWTINPKNKNNIRHKNIDSDTRTNFQIMSDNLKNGTEDKNLKKQVRQVRNTYLEILETPKNNQAFSSADYS